MINPVQFPEVLTLEEAANYLRLSREIIEAEAAKGLIPGKRILDEWRFLKAAIDDWLRSPDGRSAMLRQAGAFADDETLPQLREMIYSQRGRPEAEDSATT